MFHFIGDAHTYESHVDMLQAQLEREPFPAPQLAICHRGPAFDKSG